MRSQREAIAKVNLFLRVTARRADGYHELETLFWPFPAISDRVGIDFDAKSGIALDCSSPLVPSDSRNLAVRAAEAFAGRTGIVPAWRIRLEKAIPVAAGLGGGSSDAAAVLKLLNEHYRSLAADELAHLACKLGADVPYFLDPVPAVATGIGERITPLGGSFDPPEFLILFPGFPVSAKWSYRHLDPSSIGAADPVQREQLINSLRTGDASGAAGAWRNDLEVALFVKFPLLGILRDELLAAGAAGVMVSGSGPSLLAVLPREIGSKQVEAAVRAAHPENRELRFFSSKRRNGE